MDQLQLLHLGPIIPGPNHSSPSLKYSFSLRRLEYLIVPLLAWKCEWCVLSIHNYNFILNTQCSSWMYKHIILYQHAASQSAVYIALKDTHSLVPYLGTRLQDTHYFMLLLIHCISIVESMLSDYEVLDDIIDDDNTVVYD